MLLCVLSELRMSVLHSAAAFFVKLREERQLSQRPHDVSSVTSSVVPVLHAALYAKTVENVSAHPARQLSLSLIIFFMVKSFFLIVQIVLISV